MLILSIVQYIVNAISDYKIEIGLWNGSGILNSLACDIEESKSGLA